MRSDQHESGAMKFNVNEFELRVIIDVIEVQNREHAGIRARPSKALFWFGCVETVQAERAEKTAREEIYDGRYNKTIAAAEFSDFVDEQFLPWAKGNKLSYADDFQEASGN